MTKYEYDRLQESFTKKIENNPYRRAGCTKYETGYKEGILAAKSILSGYFKSGKGR